MLEAKHGIRIGNIARGIIVVFAVTIALCAPMFAYADEPDSPVDSITSPSTEIAYDETAIFDEADGFIKEDADDETDGATGEDDADGMTDESGDPSGENNANGEPAEPTDSEGIDDGIDNNPDSPVIENDGDAVGDLPQSGETITPANNVDSQSSDDAAAGSVDVDTDYCSGNAGAVGEFATKGLERSISPNEEETIEAPVADAALDAVPNDDDAAAPEASQLPNDEGELPESDEAKPDESEAEADEPEAAEDEMIVYAGDIEQTVTIAPAMQASEGTCEAEDESEDPEPELPAQPTLPMPLESNGPTAPPTTLSSQMRSMGDAEQFDCLGVLEGAESSSFRLSVTRAFSGKAPRSTAPCLGQHRCRSPNAPFAL